MGGILCGRDNKEGVGERIALGEPLYVRESRCTS
jgi:hypothetical protein